MRIILMLAAFAAALVACQDARISGQNPSSTQALSGASSLLPGETSGCSGDDCDAGKADVDQ